MLTLVLAQIDSVTDREFMVELYESYKYIMFATVRKYESCPESVEDLVQDSLLRLIPKLPVVRELAPNARIAYVVNTVRNTAIDHRRRKAVEEKYIDNDAELWETPEALRGVEDALTAGERAEAVCRALERLPEREQTVLRGRYYLHCTDVELAELLGCKAGSVRAMLTRARRHMLELLREEGFDYDIA